MNRIITKCEYIRVTLEELKSFLENPKQRNTAHRAETAKKHWLKTWHHHHGMTFAASQMPDGSIILADGHTRRHLIETGHFPSSVLPKYFTVLLHPATSFDEVMGHYDLYDSSDCVERASDKNYSALRSLGYRPQSERFQKTTDLGCIHSLLCEGVKSSEREVWLNLWLEEIIAIDQMDIPLGSVTGVGKTVTAPFIAAMCQCLAAGYNIEDVKDFTLKVRADEGVQKGSKRDGVSHFVRWYTTTDLQKSGGSGYHVTRNYAIRCFLMYVKSQIKTSITPFTREMKAFNIVRKPA